MQNNPQYIQSVRTEDNRHNQAILLLVFIFFGSLVGVGYLAKFLFPGPDHDLLRFLMAPLAFIPVILIRCAASYREKNRKIPTHSMEQYELDFRKNVFDLTSNPQKIAQFFQQLESHHTMKQHFDLPHLFNQVSEQQKKFETAKNRSQKEQCQFDITKILVPLFNHYFERLQHPERYPSNAKPEVVAAYQSVIRSVDPLHNRDFLCTTTTPSLPTKITPHNHHDVSQTPQSVSYPACDAMTASSS